MTAKRVFVLGATGLIGGHAARALSDAGHNVLVLARTALARDALKSAQISPILGDVADRDALQLGIDEADVVLFAPSLGDGEAAVVDWMFDRMVDTGKTFIFCSGTGVVGQRTLGAWSGDSFAEDDPFTPPRSIAGRVAIETKVRTLSKRTRARGIVVRPPAVWTEDRPHALVTNVFDSAQATGAACYIGQGLNVFACPRPRRGRGIPQRGRAPHRWRPVSRSRG